MKSTVHLLLTALIVVMTTVAFAQDSTTVTEAAPEEKVTQVPQSTNPFDRAVFPTKDQGAEQQLSDQLACYNWATEQEGWDPKVAYDKLKAEHGEVLSQFEEAQGGAVRGAAGGALMGLAIGAIAGDAGKGAAIGAVAGGGAGGVRSRRSRRGAKSEFEAAAEEFKAAAVGWDGQWTACMKGKDYSVE